MIMKLIGLMGFLIGVPQSIIKVTLQNLNNIEGNVK